MIFNDHDVVIVLGRTAFDVAYAAARPEKAIILSSEESDQIRAALNQAIADAGDCGLMAVDYRSRS